MKVEPLGLEGLLLIEPRLFRDQRGQFLEAWNRARYAEAGLPDSFVQDNVSWSRPRVLRGLHLQDPFPQGKLVSVLQGEVWDVAVDLRPGSGTFGQWRGVTLSADNARQLYVPEGFAHGFVVTSQVDALFVYKCTESYRPETEITLRWDDADLAIDWPVADPVLSETDRAGLRLRQVHPE